MLSVGYQILLLGIAIGYLAFCIWAGYRKSTEIKNATDYFLASKDVTFWFLFFTCWASFSGAGNFIGYAGRGAIHGISGYWLYFGEVLIGYFVFGFILAPYLARFGYVSMAHYLSDYLAGGNPLVRRVAGFANLLPNVCWVGGQVMGLSYLWTMIFGVDPRIVMVIVGFVFIYYTVSGGIKAVIYTDFFQGIMQLALAVAVVGYLIKVTHLDVPWVRETLIKQDPVLWQWFPGGIMTHVSTFLVGLFGGLSNPIFWNRAFCAKDVKTAKRAFRMSMSITIVVVALVIFLGLAARAMNPNVGDQATIWFVFSHTHPIVQVLTVFCVMAATMSTADTHLNCGAANLVMDIVDPEAKLSDKAQVNYSRMATLVAGIFAVAGAVIFPTILDLAMFGYAVCGGVLIPFFVIGWLLRDKSSEKFKSGLSLKAAQTGLIIGTIVAVLFEGAPSLRAWLGGGIIPAIVVTTVVLLAMNAFGKDVSTPVSARG